MKLALKIFLIVLMLVCGRTHGLVFKETDLLLVFRKDGFNDVVYNLGSVSNYLGLAQGTQLVSTNWDLSVVKKEYALTDNARFILMATTSSTAPDRRLWLSSAEGQSVPTDLSRTTWSQFFSKIDGAGKRAAQFTETNDVPYYSVSPTHPLSYTYVISSAGTSLSQISTLGGVANFEIEGVIPGKIRLFEIKSTTANPRPDATLVGTFEMSAEGVLTFTAGAGAGPVVLTPSRITNIVREGTRTTINFSTTATVKYRARYSANGLQAGPLGNWTVLPAIVTGDGSTGTIVDEGAADASRFYAVETFQ